MQGNDENGVDVRELRTLLKSAQNDVKRYASQVIRLQQELDRAQLVRNGPGRVRTELVGEELQEKELEHVTQETERMEASLDKLFRDAASVCDGCHCHRDHVPARDNETAIAQQIQDVKDVICAQKKQIQTLTRENEKLRDTLEKRPTHRDLARSQWQIERLQLQLARLREDQQFSNQFDDSTVPVFDTVPQETLTDRISVDKLLSWLHVETKQVKHLEGTSTKRNRRRFLKEPVECYLVLDSVALEGPPSMNSLSMTENEKMKKREQLSRRVGILCSEIVASCCHTVGVYEIADLPRYVESTYQYAQLVPYLQDFVHRIDDLTLAAAVGTNTAKKKDPQTRDATTESILETLSHRVQDLVFEVRARREQMKPPGDRAFAVVLRCMKLLQADRIDELGPTIEKLIETAKTEKKFLRDVRQVLGLDVTAPRATVLNLIVQIMDQIGLSPTSAQSTRRSSLHGHSSHQV